MLLIKIGILMIFVAFVELSTRETERNISNWVTSVFEEWSISNRDVIAFIADNGANMVKSGEYLTNERDISFFRCSAHTLQLAIKDTLKSNEYIQNCISQSRSFVTAIHTSYILMRRYKEICIEKNERCRKLNSDV